MILKQLIRRNVLATNIKYMNILKKWFEKQKFKTAQQKIESIRNDFSIIEKDNGLWLTHLGVAFKEVDSNKSARDAAQELNQARLTAIRYAGLKIVHFDD